MERLSFRKSVWIILLFLGTFSGILYLHTQDPGSVHLFEFLGLNTFQDSSKIKDGQAQDLQNVLTDAGYLEKRPGMVRYASVLDGFKVEHLFEFIAPSKTKYLIAHSSDSIYQTDLSGTFVRISSMTSGNTVDFTSAFAKLYWVDGTAPMKSWDGTSTATVNGPPVCSFLEFADERLYCANTAASSSRVDVSSFGGAGFWTIPATLTPDSPNSFTFQLNDGEAITCFKSTPWGKVVGKRHSMHILRGYDNNTYTKRLISPNVGCLDDRTMQVVDGTLVWLSQEGLYGWQGSGPPEHISKEIPPTISAIRQLSSVRASWLVSSQVDWEKGTISKNGPADSWSTTIEVGSLMPSTWTRTDTTDADFSSGTLTNLLAVGGAVIFSTRTLDDFTDGDLTASPVWTQYGTRSFEVNNGEVRGAAGGSGANTVMDTPQQVAVSTFTFQFRHNIDSNNASVNVFFMANACNGTGCDGYAVCVRNTSVPSRLISLHRSGSGDACASGTTTVIIAETSIPKDLNIHNVKVIRKGTGTFQLYHDSTYINEGTNTSLTSSTVYGIHMIWNTNIYIDSITVSNTSGNIVSQTFDTYFTTPTFGPFNIDMSSDATGTVTFEVQASTANNGGGFETLVSQTPGNKIAAAARRFFRYKASFANNSPMNTSPQINSAGGAAASTGTYTSEVKFIDTKISAWRTGDFLGEFTRTNIVSYEYRAATNTFTSLSSTPSYVAHTNNTTIATSTGAYVQFRITSSLDSSSQTLKELQATTNWQEGTEQPMASAFKDHRYLLSVTLSSTSTKNDAILVIQKNNQFTKFTGKSIGAMTLYDNNLYGGDGGTTSDVWKMMVKDVYRDDTDAIDASWTSKDFTIGESYKNKELWKIWVDAAYQSGSTLDISYAVNKSTSFTTKTINLDAAADFINKEVVLNDGYALGKYLKFKLRNATIDQYFKVNGYTPYARVQELTQD